MAKRRLVIELIVECNKRTCGDCGEKHRYHPDYCERFNTLLQSFRRDWSRCSQCIEAERKAGT